ncbi:MAG: GNAT family N-acetyltransferase [Candidatus Cohnella colombiensis]|uniref:GNAT family N-acetyltransferase n=1 Tax=Candidatus Cohnella colombiensis TaxID=3121368 RepID=A0AA95EVU7_9BACL|nr:MAG: GNAT family N-acetyltransferase [Cohnella sp.]
MPDMLVKLYDLPSFESVEQYEQRTGITIRRAIAPEKHIIEAWVEKHFHTGWVSECEVALSRSPITCIIATENGKLLGFACYDATTKGFFGPTGVDESERGRGIGKMLLMYSLYLMRLDGYGYAVIGGAGPTEFYAKTTGAIVIENSEPGVYKGMLR